MNWGVPTLLLAVGALAGLATLAPGAPASRPAPAALAPVTLHGVDISQIDRAVDPCSDFFEYANGRWRVENPIPEGQPRWSQRQVSRALNRQRVRAILEELAAAQNLRAGSAGQLLGDHFAACMDEEIVARAGIAPLSALLSMIDGTHTLSDLQAAIRRLHEVGVAVPFTVTSALDFHDPNRTLASLGAAALPERALFADPAERERRIAHGARLLTLAGKAEGEARRDAEAVVALEQRLAEAALDAVAAADPAATDHLLPFGELESLASHFDWRLYFDDAALPRVDLNVAEPDFFRRLDAELVATPVATWRAYLAWQLLESAAPWLSPPFVAESDRFVLGDGAAGKPRAERCVESVEALFPEALGREYAERHFPPAAKEKVQEIARNLLSALAGEVASVDWMEAETKRLALEKLAATNLELGYPDTWSALPALPIRRDSLWANVSAARRALVEEDRGRVGKPTDRDLWALAPSSPGAYLDLQLNKLVLPAGFLQPPYFDPVAADAVNYGALGVVLAHDLTHAIDAGGSEVDLQGRPRNWWSDLDRAGFAERGRCVAEQFEGYLVAPGVRHEGSRVLAESIADLAGVRVALRALRGVQLLR
ncbi:MAG: M13 family metallopeptidase, partial [Thermoanaerobaculia bacterium]